MLGLFKKQNVLMVVALLIYFLITYPKMLFHIPWYDEWHAYMLAQQINFSNWIEILSAEGHPLMWFMLIKPFALLNIYPLPMLIINYIFCFSALVLMWKKAPFNKFIKLIITFSSMFIIYLPIIARGYSTGIFLIFLLCVYFNKKEKHPVLYSLLLGLSMQVNVITCIGISWFILEFIYSCIIKKLLNKKDAIISIAILFFSCLLTIFPFFFGMGDRALETFNPPNILPFIRFFTRTHCYFLITYLVSAIAIFRIEGVKHKLFLIYTLASFLILFSFIYGGATHHFFLVLFYLIPTLWISGSEAKSKVIIIALGLMLFFPLYKYLRPHLIWDNINTRNLINIINTSPDFYGQTLYLQPFAMPLVPYIKNMNTRSLCTLKDIDYKTNAYCPDKHLGEFLPLAENSTKAYIIDFKPRPEYAYLMYANTVIIYCGNTLAISGEAYDKNK